MTTFRSFHRRVLNERGICPQIATRTILCLMRQNPQQMQRYLQPRSSTADSPSTLGRSVVFKTLPIRIEILTPTTAASSSPLIPHPSVLNTPLPVRPCDPNPFHHPNESQSNRHSQPKPSKFPPSSKRCPERSAPGRRQNRGCDAPLRNSCV